ncbi:hypothetical protein Pyn_23408 [Prunus yedoensis var. nudiflora]|uniref:Uncharacterized protein n=1 Tax=Prunus yedoensis var. nudiflora TaxID=2094558 RepID=A0A314YE00_PRUYE|nr:hypothetical protein Pyn_23408 [Prunus yedoensis var. nudiflora]
MEGAGHQVLSVAIVFDYADNGIPELDREMLPSSVACGHSTQLTSLSQLVMSLM